MAAPTLLARKRKFSVDVKEIRELVDVTVDDAFAESLGLPDLNALSNALRARLEQDYTSFSRKSIETKLAGRIEFST